MANVGSAAHSQGDLMRRVHILEGLVRELIAGRRLEDATVGAGGITVRGEGGVSLTDGGGLSVDSGGFIAMVSANGQHYVVFIGTASDGRRFFQLRREDGELMLSTGSFGDAEFWALWDRSSHIVASDDAESGWGLANPRIVGALYPSWRDLDGIGHTASTTYVPMWEGEFPLANPWLRIGFRVSWYGPESSGQVRILFNGDVVYESPVLHNQVSNTGRIDVHTGRSPGDLLHVEMEGRLASGTGEAIVLPLGMYAT